MATDEVFEILLYCIKPACEQAFCHALILLLLPFSNYDDILIYYQEYTYTIIIFDIDISSFQNEGFQCEFLTCFSCSVHRSLLIERNKYVTQKS